MMTRRLLVNLILVGTVEFVSSFVTPKSAAALWRLQAATTTTAVSTTTNTGEEIIETDYVVCGGGPAGLLSAIMLANKFPNEQVQLYDRLVPPPSPSDEGVWSDVAKFYLIGLGSRGQNALKEYGILDEVAEYSVPTVGRIDWAPGAEEGNEQIFTDRKVQTIVLPRDKLAGILHQHILENYAGRIQLNNAYEISPIDFGTKPGQKRVLVRAGVCSATVSNRSAGEDKTAAEQQEEVLCDTDSSILISAKLLVAADGTVRTIANAIQASDAEKFRTMNPLQRMFAGSPFQVRRYPDDNRRIYKTIPMKLPEGWRKDINYSARTKGSRIVFDALPADRNGNYCGVLLLREKDSLAQPNADPAELREALDTYLPQFSELIDDEMVNIVAKKPPSYLPAFRYIGPRLNEGDKVIVLGDCAHTIKPYFGLGANSALEDVKIFGDIIDESPSLGHAVYSFSRRRAKESKKLVTISRNLDRPGFLGFITFILPIILDAIFHKSFPSVFSPNVITMMQRDDLTFTEVARKKRIDRLGQIALLFGGGYGFFQGTKLTLKLTLKVVVVAVKKVLGLGRIAVVAGGIIAGIVGLKVLKELLLYVVFAHDKKKKTKSGFSPGKAG